MQELFFRSFQKTPCDKKWIIKVKEAQLEHKENYLPLPTNNHVARQRQAISLKSAIMHPLNNPN